ncbi:ribonuclease H-like domain-containing protein [Tanacetum coccineum]|uniref:Ribonuclease H-like domain-containing protein n=1 Tax=Tanacetum coccineum TaxID=301880 RepID=A0ABQ4WRZ6_9ASTR
MANQRPPSFFHILMNPSSPHLPLPLKFVTKHLRKEILEDPIIKSANGGYLWKLKMKKIDDQSYCFVDGWCNVVKDVGLLFREFLLFRYVGSSVFIMHIYSVNGCEKILVPKIKVVDDEVEEEEDVVYDVDDVDDDMEEDEDVVYAMDDDDEDDHHHMEDEDDVEFVDDGDEDNHDMEEDDDVLYDMDDDDDVEDEDDIDYVYDGNEDDDVDVDGDHGDPFFILTSSKSNKNKLVNKLELDKHIVIELLNSARSGHICSKWLKRILRYLHGTVEHGMLIRRSFGSTLQAFTDVLWKGNPDTSFEAFSDDDWGLEIQMIDEAAEYKALADTVAELTWLQSLLNELGIRSSSTPILWCDNLGATFIIGSLNNEFDMTDLGALNYFLGIFADRTPTGAPVQDPTLYRSLAGGLRGLQYLTFTHPDLSYAVQQICLYMHDPREPHLAALKRILRYVQGTLDLGLQWLVILLIGRVVHLHAGLMLWLAQAFFLVTYTVCFCENNQGKPITLHRWVCSGKHIEIDIHFVRDMVTSGQVRVLHVPFRFQYADIFTKGLPSALFEEFRSSLSIDIGIGIRIGIELKIGCISISTTYFGSRCLDMLVTSGSASVWFCLVLPRLRFSPDFVALARIDTRETITLKNEDGSEKEMTVESDKKRKSTSYYVAAGWKEFQRSNGISEGDKCVFKFITSQDKICLAKITKKKTLARPLPSAAESPLMEVDADDVEDDDSMDDNDAEDDNDKDEDEDVELVDEDDPFFVVTITPTHNRVLRMPADFVRSAGIDTKKTLTLRSLDGNEMAMPVQFDTQYGYHTKRYFLLKGWKDFMQGTNILEGDKVVFKFITSEDKLCLAKITKPPPAAEAQATPINDDDDKDENEDVEPVDDVDPFFVATITTSHKFRLVLPTDFVGLAGIDTKETIIMISLDGNECQMAVRKYKQKLFTRYHLSDGWHAFMHSNNISQGDKCVFKYITSEDKMCLAKIIKARTKEVHVDDRDPSFVVTITITNNIMLPLPPDFITLAGIDTKENIIMKSIDGNESQMAVRLDKRFNSAQYHLSVGWVAFKRSNNISQGDECVFKYITSEDKMCLVKITKASSTEVDDGMDVEDDNDTDEDENVKPVDDADPFFVVTIIPSHNRMLLLPTDFVALARIVGWMAFKRCNNISDGDECVFKYIKSEDKMCLAKITKKLPVDNDDMDDEDVVEKGKGEDAKLVDEDDDNDNEEDDYDHDGDDGDPSFILNISKANQYKLRFSPDFVALARIDTRETITLKNDDGYEKEMPVQSDKKRNSTSYYVVTGWKEFQQSNDISEGDKCVFKFITSEDKICLAKITKTKTRARPLPPAAEAPVTEVDADDVEDDDGMDDKDSEDDNDKDEDEDVELDDDVDPFFVATITTIHKNRLNLPTDFARLAGIDTKENILVISLDGNECQMAVRKDKRKLSTQYRLSNGWRAFMRSNNISQGDKCAFKYITSEDKMCLAKINKAEEDPSFVVTITTTHKSMLVDVIMRKVQILLSMDDDAEWKTYLDDIDVDLKFVEEQRLNLFSNEKLTVGKEHARNGQWVDVVAQNFLLMDVLDLNQTMTSSLCIWLLILLRFLPSIASKLTPNWHFGCHGLLLLPFLPYHLIFA